MDKISKSLVIGVVLLLAIAVVPAAARGVPQDVTIVAVQLFDGSPGAFVASGSAVPSLVCESGTVETKDWAWRPPAEPPDEPTFKAAWTIKQFTCDDDEGIFYLKLEIKFVGNGTTSTWMVVDWPEDPNPLDLEELQGQGRASFEMNPDGSGGTDTYTGQLRE